MKKETKQSKCTCTILRKLRYIYEKQPSKTWSVMLYGFSCCNKTLDTKFPLLQGSFPTFIKFAFLATESHGGIYMLPNSGL